MSINANENELTYITRTKRRFDNAEKKVMAFTLSLVFSIEYVALYWFTLIMFSHILSTRVRGI